VTAEPKVTRQVYSFNNTFKNSESVKINGIWKLSPDIVYTLGKKIIANTQSTAMFKKCVLTCRSIGAKKSESPFNVFPLFWLKTMSKPKHEFAKTQKETPLEDAWATFFIDVDFDLYV